MFMPKFIKWMVSKLTCLFRFRESSHPFKIIKFIKNAPNLPKSSPYIKYTQRQPKTDAIRIEAAFHDTRFYILNFF